MDKLNLMALYVVGASFFLLGIHFGSNITDSYYAKQAIEKGFAEYNQVTGKWQWKEKGK